MKLALIAFDKTGVIRAGATGQITCTDFPSDGSNPLSATLGQSWQANRVSLDMSQVPYIDSAAVGWLINCQREASKAGGSFVVHSVQPQVKQLLDLLKIGKVVKMADNEATACELAAGGVK